MSKPLISIITVVRNGEAFINQCIYSVQAASFVDFEHVVVDGGSTDRTVVIANDLATRIGSAIKVVQIQDRSMTEGLRNGCSVASGTWILPLNVDDQYIPQAGLRVEQLLRDTTDEMLLFDVLVRRASGRIKHLQRPWLGGGLLAWDLLGCFVAECGVAMRADTLSALGGYDQSYRLAADYDLYLKFARRGRVGYGAVLLGIFNETGANLSITQKKQILNEAGRISRFGSFYAKLQEYRLDKLLRVIARVQAYDIGVS